MAGATPPERSLLVVEDDPLIRESLADVLEGEGFEVVTAEHGKEALERLRTMKRPSLVLLDLMMPVMDGRAFLHALRRDDALATLPVVIVSAWAEDAAKLGRESQGFVKKPVSLEALLEVVHRLCAAPAPPRSP
ncbi:MAG TPA: response regulator [Planctomycetota bacterium]|nr:response regulator [Planctomycetota bacterium]